MSQLNDTLSFHEIACFSIKKQDILLVFDPHNGISMGFPPPNVRNATIVLCSHKHYDHNNGKNLVSNSKSFILEEKEGDFKFKDIQIHGTKVKHGDFTNCGYCVVYSVKFPDGFIIVHGSDMGFIPDKTELASITCLGRPHIVILPIGGFYCLNSSEAIKTANLMDPSLTCIMYHFKYGPLLFLEDFRPMSDEKPFIQIAGNELEILHERTIALKRRFKKYTIFSS